MGSSKRSLINRNVWLDSTRANVLSNCVCAEKYPALHLFCPSPFLNETHPFAPLHRPPPSLLTRTGLSVADFKDYIDELLANLHYNIKANPTPRLNIVNGDGRRQCEPSSVRIGGSICPACRVNPKGSGEGVGEMVENVEDGDDSCGDCLKEMQFSNLCRVHVCKLNWTEYATRGRGGRTNDGEIDNDHGCDGACSDGACSDGDRVWWGDEGLTVAPGERCHVFAIVSR